MRDLASARQAELFGALAHPVRLRILEILADGEACVCHLSTALHQRQPYISQQLSRLKEAGLIATRRDGLYIYYALADPGIVDLLRSGRQAAARLTGGEPFVEPSAAAQGVELCPCPRCQAARLTAKGQTVAAASMP